MHLLQVILLASVRSVSSYVPLPSSRADQYYQMMPDQFSVDRVANLFSAANQCNVTYQCNVTNVVRPANAMVFCLLSYRSRAVLIYIDQACQQIFLLTLWTPGAGIPVLRKLQNGARHRYTGSAQISLRRQTPVYRVCVKL